MKYSHIFLAATLGIVGAGCSNIERSRDLANPKVSATTLAQQVCSLCHGVDGYAISPNFPNLAGQTQPYLISELNEFKSHGRLDPAGYEYMWGISRSLTDEQIAGLAAYYAAQVKVRQPVEGEAARISAGQTIFTAGLPEKNVPPCFACHGVDGQGNETFPRLAGQHADYVAKQLAVFQRTDDRPDGQIMKTIAHELTHNDIENVAAYVQSIGNQ
jgi:cytochrome c553